jgi:hypothetical protein
MKQRNVMADFLLLERESEEQRKSDHQGVKWFTLPSAPLEECGPSKSSLQRLPGGWR